MTNLSIIKNKTVEIIKEEELIKKFNYNRPLRVKLGIDATGPDIHLGFAVVLNKLREFQELGHIGVLIVGDFTAKIGDPSGRIKTRPPLTDEEIKENLKTYKEQIFKILIPEKTEFRYNSEWHSKLTSDFIIKMASKFTLSQIIERDDFSLRYKNNEPIALHELLYALFQAYDSVAVNADIELGGTDQKFNLLFGRELQVEFGQEPQVAILMPLLEGTDGIKKMSKSYNNYIGIAEEPKEMFGKIMSIPDSCIIKYFRLATKLTDGEIEKIEKMLNESNPRDVKLRLAYEIVSTYYSSDVAKEEEKNFLRVFSKKELPKEMPIYNVKDKKIWIVKLLVDTNMATTRSDARRLIEQSAVKIDGNVIKDVNLEIEIKEGFVLKCGKRKFIKVQRG